MSEENLRTLIRLIPPARALSDNLEKNIEMELFDGTGDMAVQTYEGLLATIAAIDDSPFVAGLKIKVPAGAGEKEKVALVQLAANQLLAYLEGQTGLVGMGGGGGDRQYNSPAISIANIKGVPAGTIDSMLEVAGANKGKSKAAEDDE